MNNNLSLNQLQNEYPDHSPGSDGMKAIFAALKAKTALWGVEGILKKSPIYSFQTSITVFFIISLTASLLTFILPFTGAIISSLSLILLIMELFRPLLAKIAPRAGENFEFTIPARNKEFQKVILIANLSDENFISPAQKLSTKTQLTLIYSLAFAATAVNLLTWLTNFKLLNLVAIITLTAMLFLNRSQRQKNTSSNSLENAQILMETAQLLLKVRPSTTSVTCYFTDSNSLNSGLLKLPTLLKGNKLAYLINLINYPGEELQLVTHEGFFISQASDSFLQDLLHEVANEKSIKLANFKLAEQTAAYQLNFQKLKAISITNPTTPTSNKALRELLVGLIRKVEE